MRDYSESESEGKPAHGADVSTRISFSAAMARARRCQDRIRCLLGVRGDAMELAHDGAVLSLTVLAPLAIAVKGRDPEMCFRWVEGCYRMLHCVTHVTMSCFFGDPDKAFTAVAEGDYRLWRNAHGEVVRCASAADLGIWDALEWPPLVLHTADEASILDAGLRSATRERVRERFPAIQREVSELATLDVVFLAGRLEREYARAMDCRRAASPRPRLFLGDEPQ